MTAAAECGRCGAHYVALKATCAIPVWSPKRPSMRNSQSHRGTAMAPKITPKATSVPMVTLGQMAQNAKNAATRLQLPASPTSYKRFLTHSQANPVQQPFSVGVVKSRPTMEARMIFTVGWLAVLLGLLAMQWADNGGGFSWHS